MIEGQEIWKVLDFFGADSPPDSGGWQPMRCPFHQPDATKSGRVNPSEGAFACLGCGVKGDAISLIMQRERIDFVRALDRYKEVTGGEVPDLQRSTSRKPGRRVLRQQRDYDRDGGAFSNWVRRRPPTR